MAMVLSLMKIPFRGDALMISLAKCRRHGISGKPRVGVLAARIVFVHRKITVSVVILVVWTGDIHFVQNYAQQIRPHIAKLASSFKHSPFGSTGCDDQHDPIDYRGQRYGIGYGYY